MSDNEKTVEKDPELIFGLVGAIGTNLELVAETLTESLKSAGYQTTLIRLSDLMRELKLGRIRLPDKDAINYYESMMNAGNSLRKKLSRNDALAALAIARMRALRAPEGRPSIRRAYILQSLKRAEEVKLLRKVYGSSFFVISAYAPRASRVDRLSSLLAERQHKNQSNALRSQAEKLIIRDENESLSYGQDVRKTYPLADLFVRTTSASELQTSLARFVAIIFGDLWRTPTKDEQGMMLAYIASFRSASPARQVGAAITCTDGKVLAVGANEVPRAGGGQYWEDDKTDGRDYAYDAQDLSDRMRINLLSDVVDRLRELKYLSKSCPPTNELLRTTAKSFGVLKEAQLFDTIDFIRAVHAEASALLAAGISANSAVLYVTTFPCHECARHIVFSGVKRVVYVEPYPKSLVSELFKDSISVDPSIDEETRVNFVPFVGLAPSQYTQAFKANLKSDRKGKDGAIKKWSLASSFPHLHEPYSLLVTRVAEEDTLEEFGKLLKKEGITYEPKRKTGNRNRKGLARKGAQRGPGRSRKVARKS